MVDERTRVIPRNFAALSDSDGSPQFWVGANYWSRSGGPRMWREFDAGVVREELATLCGLGMTVTRSFLYWPDVMPEPHRLDGELLDRFETFLDLHHEQGMTTIPTFIVGHMSGDNWDPAWRAGRDIFGDVWFVGRQAWYVRSIAQRFAQHPAIAAWLLTNEIPIYADWRTRGVGTIDHQQVHAWASILVDALRAGGARQPVSVGDGAWGLEITGMDNGFRLRELADVVDFVGPHVYRVESDITRQNLGAAFICELAALGQPVVMEEFGLSSDFVGGESAAAYYRQTLHNTLLAGATGWLTWNNTDYDHLYERRPYSLHAHEMHFGLTTVAGEPKPQALEVKAFADLLQRIDVTSLRRPAADAALVVSSYLEGDYDFTQPGDATAVFQATHQAYVATKEADLPVAVVREADGIPDGASLYLVPSIKHITAASWHRLRELATAGATVYVSYFNGDHPVHRGAWWPDLEETFGVDNRAYYGVTSPVPDDAATFTFTADLGAITAGTELTFPMGGDLHGRSFLPVTPREGTEVVAVDADGSPAILLRPTGAGRMVLCTYPLEYAAANRWHDNPEDSPLLYGALADLAGVVRPVSVPDVRVSTAWLEHPDGDRYLWLVNLSGDEIDATPTLTAGELNTLDGAPVQTVRLGAYGVDVLRWRGAATPSTTAL